MNKTLKTGGKPCVISLNLCISFVGGLLAGCTTYVERPNPPVVSYPEPAPPPPVYVPAPAPVYVPQPVYQVRPQVGIIEIQTESDFDEPLRPYGRWEFIEPYGRCWVPSGVDPDWRPYSDGSWKRTPDGWYWQSNEPWGWATYHYGRWDFYPRLGWFWVPQTQWAPAWVEWRRGAGYVGWAPLHPSARLERTGVIERNERPLPQRHYVFVEERKFLAPVRPATTVVNNTTVINNTVNITNVKVVNNTVINEGPQTTVIERASGQKVQTAPVQELRRAQEAPVIAKRERTPRVQENIVQSPAAQENPNRGNNARPEGERRGAEARYQAQTDISTAAKQADMKAAQAEAERVANEAKARAQKEAQQKAREERQAIQSKFQAQEEAQRIARERDARLETERKANQAKLQSQQEAQRVAEERNRTNRIEVERRRAAEAEAERVANEAKVKAQKETQRKAMEERQAIQSKFQAQQEAQRIAQERETAARLETERKANQAKLQSQQEAQKVAEERSRTNRIEVDRRASDARGAAAPEQLRAPGEPVPDSAMALRVQRALALNPRYRQVRVAVSKGVLELSGFAATEEVKKQASDFVKSVAGVKTVQNNISTNPENAPKN